MNSTGYTFYIFQTRSDGRSSMEVKFHSLLENGFEPVEEKEDKQFE